MKTVIKALKIILFWVLFIGISGYAYDSDAFVIKVKTDNTGSSSSTEFTIPTYPPYESDYSYNVDCNNSGSNDVVDETDDYTCSYQSAGEKVIVITGDFPAIYFNGNGDAMKILDIEQWGNQEWRSMSSAFHGAENLTMTAIDAPDLSQVYSTSRMFAYASSFNANVDDWNVSNIGDMSSMFEGAWIFNQPLNSWDVSSVTTMGGMFFSAEYFNQDIGDWNVSLVTYLDDMFALASRFNQDIGDWNTSNVSYMRGMFNYARDFNKSVANWDVSGVSDMSRVFFNAYDFNQDIGSWDVSNVLNMREMFCCASDFNQDIGNWDVSSVTDMHAMFSSASDFNQDIVNWDISGVTNMQNLFRFARSFDQDIGEWDVSGVSNMQNLFAYSGFNQDISDWDIRGVVDPVNLEGMFTSCALTVSNYDNLLKAWDRLNLVDGVSFDSGNDSEYCQGTAAKANIMNDDSWNFNDNGENCEFYITTPNEISIENGERNVTRLSSNVASTFTIVGGADEDKFIIDDNRDLRFIEAPDFHNPTDNNGDNVYRVQVKATKLRAVSPQEDYQTIKVKVVSDINGALVPIINYLLN